MGVDLRLLLLLELRGGRLDSSLLSSEPVLEEGFELPLLSDGLWEELLVSGFPEEIEVPLNFELILSTALESGFLELEVLPSGFLEEEGSASLANLVAAGWLCGLLEPLIVFGGAWDGGGRTGVLGSFLEDGMVVESAVCV